jgi:hypothetical protein
MPKKWINLILSTAVFIIWIVIFYKYFLTENNDDNISGFREKEAVHKTVGKKIGYETKAVHDPFQNPFNFRQKPIINRASEKASKKQVKPLNIKLLGILTDERGRLAIIEFESGATLFIRVGEQVQGIKVIKILDNEIEVLYENRKIKVGL